jgi:hypothetical protein
MNSPGDVPCDELPLEVWLSDDHPVPGRECVYSEPVPLGNWRESSS